MHSSTSKSRTPFLLTQGTKATLASSEQKIPYWRLIITPSFENETVFFLYFYIIVPKIWNAVP